MNLTRRIDRWAASLVRDAVGGWLIREIIGERGVEVYAMCGSASACAICHLKFDSDWASNFAPANDNAEVKLEDVPAVGAPFRLSRRVMSADALSGLTVRLVVNG
jgi:ferredoxin